MSTTKLVLNNNEQNGRQSPSLPNQGYTSKQLLPSESRNSNVFDQQKAICRKYVWGTCNKDKLCKFRHELIFDEMIKILKFCHDYQNKKGCTRIDCSYLHTSSDEQNLFLTTGHLPVVLQERYSAMHPETTNCLTNMEGIPQMVFVTPPPPPPPPPPAQGPVMNAAPPPPPPPLQPLPYSAVQQPPPPPPPTAPPVPMVQAPPIFSAPPPVVLPLNLFSRPPPPLPGPSRNGGVKRHLDDEAGPSKIRKLDEAKADSACEACRKRELRIELYKEHMEKLQREEENQRLLHKMRLDEYEAGKEKLKSIVSPELYRILEEYIEGSPAQNFEAQTLHLPSSSTNVPKTLLFQLMQCMLGDGRNSESTSSTSFRIDETLLTMPPVSRRTVPRQSSDFLHSFFEFISNSSVERPGGESQRSEVVSNAPSTSALNGYNRYANGQKVENATASSNGRYSNAANGSPRRYLGAGVPGPSGLTSGGSQAPQTTSPYPVYHPAIPPPQNRPYYSPQYASPMPNTGFNAMGRPAAPSTPQMVARPSNSSGGAPVMPPNYPYMMGRYPHPPNYYPPYQ